MLYGWLTAKLLDWRPQMNELWTMSGPVPFVILAHLMSLNTVGPERCEAKIRLIDHLYASELGADDFRELFRIIDWFLELPGEETQRFQRWLDDRERSLTMPYLTSIERLAMSRGEKKGALAEALEMLQRALSSRFGAEGRELAEQLKSSQDREYLHSIFDLVLSSQNFSELLIAMGPSTPGNPTPEGN